MNAARRRAPGRAAALAVALGVVLVAAACGEGSAEGGMGLPVQIPGEAYPGVRNVLTATVALAGNGCVFLDMGDGRLFAIWPRGSVQGDPVTLADGTALADGASIEAVAARVPAAPLRGATPTYWDHVLGFCAPEADEVLVLDEVRLAG